MISKDDDENGDELGSGADSSDNSQSEILTSRGSKLESFTKGDGLRPAEVKLRIAAMRGERCIIGDGMRPEFATNENTIRASFLRYLILGGCDQTPIHQRGLRLQGAFIACRETAEYGKCLDLEAVTIRQDVGLYRCKFDGSIVLLGAKTKSLYFDGSSLFQFNADRLQCDGGVNLKNEFLASGHVRLLNAKIGGDLSCINGKFNGKKISLNCDGMETNGSVFLRDQYEATGLVRMLGAKISGDFDCSNGKFRESIDLSNSKIDANIFLNKGFQILGAVGFPNATIGGNIYCDGATFHNKDHGILANKAIIEGNVSLGDLNAAGTLAFQSAMIKGDFSANGATLSGKPCIELRNAKIEGTFHWRDIKHAVGRLNLGGASVKTINMDAASWDKPESIKLNNFTYLGFESLEQGANSNYWKRFLEKQPPDDLAKKFRPKPWEHLASVLHSMGYEEEARNIRIKRQQMHTNFMANHDPDRYATGADGRQHIKPFHRLNVWFRRIMFGPLVDYGFRPGKAFLFLIALIFIGSGVYWNAAHKGIMTPTHPLIFKEAVNGFIPKACAENWVYFPKEIEAQCADAVPSEYSEFQSFIYAADVALPIVNLRMENDWAPRVVNTDGSRNWLGYGVRFFEWLLIISGWVLSLLFASAVSGIIRR